MKKIIFSLILILLLLSPSHLLGQASGTKNFTIQVNAAGSTFGSWIPQSTRPGWDSIPNTRMDSVCPPNNFNGTTYAWASKCEQVMYAWSGGVEITNDPTLGPGMMIWGGGHNDYPGNELYFLYLGQSATDPNRLTVARLTNPTTTTQPGAGGPANLGGSCSVNIMSDGTANNSHSYGNFIQDPVNDRMVTFTGGPTCQNGDTSQHLNFYDIAHNTWSAIRNDLDADYNGSGCWNPVNNHYLILTFHSFYDYDPVGNTLTRKNSLGLDSHTRAVCDTVHGLLVDFGPSTSFTINYGDGSFALSNFTPPAACSALRATYPGLTFDSDRGLVLGYLGTGDTVYEYNAAANTCVARTLNTNPCGNPGATAGVMTRWQYEPQFKVAVLWNDPHQNACVWWPSAATADFPLRSGATTVVASVPFDSVADTPSSTLDTSGGIRALASPNGVIRSSNVVTVHMVSPAGHIVGESIVLQGCTDSSFDTTNLNSPFIVQTATDQSTFTINQVGPDAASGNCFVADVPVIDTTTTTDSGTGSLLMWTPPYSGANVGGDWHASFKANTAFGSAVDPACQPGTLVAPCVGSEFYWQYRFRITPAMLQSFTSSNGWKHSITNNSGSSSCTEIHLVNEDSNQAGYPQMYHSCGGKDNSYEQLETSIPVNGDFFDENVVWGGANKACFHYGGRGSPPGTKACFNFVANQWMTFQLHVKIGTWYINNSHNYHRDSTVEMWVAQENQPSQLVISYNDYDLVNNGQTTQAGGAEEYGQIWLLNYQTNKSTAQNNTTGQTWYHGLTVSTSRILDPGVLTPQPPDTLRATPISATQVNLTWRDNALGTAGYKVERCVNTSNTCWAGYSNWTALVTLPPGAHTYSDTSLTTGTSYTYRVYAFNFAGNSAYSGGSCWAESAGAGTHCYGTAKTF